MTDHVELRSGQARLALDLRVGHIRGFEVAGPVGKPISPLHMAPWSEDPAACPDTMPPVDRYLSGDFFCAPFGATDPSTPPHGWTANSAWRITVAPPDDDPASVTTRLGRTVAGATVEKCLRLGRNAPLLYQRHDLTGGEGSLPLAHHTMTSMRAGGRIFFSPKIAAATPDAPLVRKRHLLKYPAIAEDLHLFPGRDGTMIDLCSYPEGVGTEDFVMLVDHPDAPLGWTAVIRRAERDIVFVLKHPHDLPTTMLWFSNGGRLDPPWSGRHTGVLGIEDGFPGAYAGSMGAQLLGRIGVDVARRLDPDGTVSIRQVVGCVPAPPHWRVISAITLQQDRLRITEAGGDMIELEFDGNFFGKEAP